MEPLRIGILGAARIAESGIVTPAHVVGARLVAVAARDRSRAEQFAAAHAVERVHDSYAALLADPEIEAIYNPLANGLHGPWNLAAIAAGKHVLSEKPFASDGDEAQEVHEAGVRAGVRVGDGFHYVYHPVMRRLMQLLSTGELGTLERVEVTMVIPAPAPEDPRWSLALAGGALMDLGCYSLHASRVLGRWAGGEPTIVDVRGGERPGVPGVDEWVDVELSYPSGATGLARCHMAGAGVTMTCRAAGTRGEVTAANFVLPHLDDRLLVSSEDGERVEHLGTRTSYTYQLEAFTAWVRAGGPFPTDSADAVLTMRLIDRCYEAIGLGRRPRSPRVGR